MGQMIAVAAVAVMPPFVSQMWPRSCRMMPAQCESEYVLGHEVAKTYPAVMHFKEGHPELEGQSSHDGIRTVLAVSASQRPAGVGEPGLPATHRVCTAPSPFHPPYQLKHGLMSPGAESAALRHYPHEKPLPPLATHQPELSRIH